MINLIRTIGYTVCITVFAISFASKASGQIVVDKTVATVSDGVRTELITYSDLMWQLALVPGVPLEPASSEDLNRALQLVIRQRLIALEAERLPRGIEPTDDEIREEIEITLRSFPSTADFRQRLNTVGFKSVDDPNFRELVGQRISIQKYVDFRFRSFVVITPEQELRYYREVYTPEFRQQNPDRILPKIDDVREEINRILTEERLAEDIERFIDNAEARAEIVILNQV
ncbi:MAG: hypothetical protein DWQ43_00185 [Acidobacteria bacterium]|nr:MAG: hypothetical protein DWQ32_12340 [Acidobacteriota bacterium]REJ98692.1 MAG: hypothetical protein DWQ38_15140 [Acidobacteriota bacterium]REK16653.1 MAG: hypothetical protein DWQ43_00185 [Acidobacteriota bacterium]